MRLRFGEVPRNLSASKQPASQPVICGQRKREKKESLSQSAICILRKHRFYEVYRMFTDTPVITDCTLFSFAKIMNDATQVTLVSQIVRYIV